MRSVASVCVYIYIYVCQQKYGLFSALLLEYLLLSVIYCLVLEFKRLWCGLLHPASCTDGAIHAFPNKTQRPPGPRNIVLRYSNWHSRARGCSASICDTFYKILLCRRERESLLGRLLKTWKQNTSLGKTVSTTFTIVYGDAI